MTNTAPATTTIAPRLLRRREVLSRVGSVRPETLWRWVQAGEFPCPVRLNPGGTLVAWREDEVTAWINARERGFGLDPVTARAAAKQKREQAPVMRRGPRAGSNGTEAPVG